MKAKISKGAGFRGVFDYALGKPKAEIVAGTTAGETPRELATEYGEVRRLRTDIQKPVWHCSLALPSGEQFTPEQWQRVATAFLSRMNIDPFLHQWTAIRHHDTDHDHVHIVVNRVRSDGSIWNPRHDIYRAIEVCQVMEKDFHMILTPGREAKTFCTPAFNRGEIEAFKRTGELGSKIFVARAIAEITAQGPVPVMQFVEALRARGISSVPNVSKTRKMNGFSFEYDGVALKGSDVGASWKHLSEVVQYEPERDAERLQAIRDRNRLTVGLKKGRTVDGRNETTVGRLTDTTSGDTDDRAEGLRGEDTGRGTDLFSVGEGVGSAPTGDAGGDRTPDGDREPFAVASQDTDMDDGGGLFGWDGVLDTCAVLARSEQTDVQVNNATGELVVSKSVEYKRSLWARQAEALGAPLYRLTVRGRGRQDGKTINLCKHSNGETLWSKDDVSAKIPVLEQWNARGFDIYLTPIDDTQHHVLIDDLTSDGVTYVKEHYAPCIICSSSNGNWQAVVRVPKKDVSPMEQSAGNLLLQRLNHLPDGCGGDKSISAVRHPFRMTGFRNKKPTREDFQSKIEFWAPGQCERATAELEEIRRDYETNIYQTREMFVSSSGETEIPEAVRTEDIGTGAEEEAFREYAREWNRARGLHQQHPEWGAPDMSRWDFRASKHLIEKGYGEETTRKAIRRCSPNIHERHSNAWEYALQTVASVLMAIAKEIDYQIDRM